MGKFGELDKFANRIVWRHCSRQTENMIILVDYDNIDRSILRHGISHVINRILSKIDPHEVLGNRHVHIRLYGGWYEQNRFTTRAQNLSADISANFPNVCLLSDNSTSGIVNCEMAYSILADPSNHLFNTFRSRGIPSGLKAKHPTNCGCTNQRCPVIAAYDFINNKLCNTCGNIRPEDIFYRSEQKLVDTMLTSDLIFSSTQSLNLGVVSSDDDFWPGIKTTLVTGKCVIQIHTKNRPTPTFYTRTTSNNYIQKQL